MAYFNRGDRVTVVNTNIQTYGCTGQVESTTYGGYYVNVKLNNSNKVVTYSKMSLEHADKIQIKENKGDSKMIMGNYMVAMVKFIQGTNTTKEYAFALFDQNIEVNNLVLCDTAHGYNVARVVQIIPQSECEADVTKEIICKVDFSDYNIRKDNREKARQLKVEMEKKVKEMQELTLYEMMAEKSPELKEMLDSYKSLMG